MEGFDYVIVGAGTAGCVLAARLSEDGGARVLLLEAGSAERTRAMTVPSAWPENLGSPAEWGSVTASQAEAGPVGYPRGRALGGSGAINAMAHVRGHRAVYERWAAGGADGWGFADLLPYFRRSERADGRDPALRGTAGPIRVQPVTDPHPVARAFAAALTALGCPATGDLSGERQEGVCWADLAIAGGERVSAADGYLRPALGRPNLTVAAGCLVTRLRVRGGRCVGVSYTRDGAVSGAEAAGEVILCAGAAGSAQLLLLSGLGPARELEELGIRPVADLPGTGRNLQDHPVALLSCAARSQFPPSRYNHGEVYAALRSELAGDYPDLHLFPILLPLAPPGLAPPRAGGYVLAAGVVAPDSRGSVRLDPAAPQDGPVIDPGFLTSGRDLDRLAEGVGMIRRSLATPAFARVHRAEVWPGPDVTTGAALRAYLRRTVGSYYHPAGTCRMGRDEAAVVDPQLRVREVAGLRVADASVMPVIPNATVLAIAERAADLIRSRWPAAPAGPVAQPRGG